MESNSNKLAIIQSQIDQQLLSMGSVTAESLDALNTYLVSVYSDDAQLLLDAQKYLKERVDLYSDASLQNKIKSATKKSQYNLDTSSRYSEITDTLRPITDYYPVDKKSLGLWILEDIIPNFFPMSEELYKLQAPLLASLLLLNIREQPKRKDGLFLCSIPIITLVGVQGTGKSILLDFARWFHLSEYRIKLTSSTGAYVRDAIYNTTKGDGRGLLTIDNVFFKSENNNPSIFTEWGRFVPALNAIDQASAVTGKSTKGSDDPNEIAEAKLFILKWLSSTQNPLLYSNVSEPHKDFASRTLVIFREKLEPEFKPDDFDWTYLEEEYLRIWRATKDNLEIDRYIQTLKELKSPGTSKRLSAEYGISGRRFDITVLAVATGVYQGIWKNYHHAYQELAEYFNYIDNSRENFETSSLWKAVEFFADVWYPKKLEIGEYSPNAFDPKVFQYEFYELSFNDGNLYNKFQAKDFQELVKYLEKKGWYYGINKYTNKMCFCRKEIMK